MVVFVTGAGFGFVVAACATADEATSATETRTAVIIFFMIKAFRLFER